MSLKIPDKLFFKIGEVAEISGVEQYVLRYWEDEFDHLRPEKNKSGQRLYQKKDVEQVLKIKKLLYEEKYTIAGARKKLKTKKRPAGQMSINYNPEEIFRWKESLKSDLKHILNILE